MNLTAGRNGSYKIYVYSFTACADLKKKKDYLLAFGRNNTLLDALGKVLYCYDIWFIFISQPQLDFGIAPIYQFVVLEVYFSPLNTETYMAKEIKQEKFNVVGSITITK